jgi:hypothetical protein
MRDGSIDLDPEYQRGVHIILYMPGDAIRESQSRFASYYRHRVDPTQAASLNRQSTPQLLHPASCLWCVYSRFSPSFPKFYLSSFTVSYYFIHWSSYDLSCENAGRWRGTPNLHRRQAASDQHPTVCISLFFSIFRTLCSPSYFRVPSPNLFPLYSVDSWRMHCPVSRSQRCPTLVQSAKTELRQRLVRLLLHLHLHLLLSITASFPSFPLSFSSPSFPSNLSLSVFSTATSTTDSFTCPAQRPDSFANSTIYVYRISGERHSFERAIGGKSKPLHKTDVSKFKKTQITCVEYDDIT